MGRAAQIFCLVLLALPLAGSSASRISSLPDIPPDLRTPWRAAHNLVVQRKFQQAIVECQRLAQSAHDRRLFRAEARLLSLEASAETGSFQFRKAAQTYLRAQRTAERAQDWPMSALISFNLSNVYFHLGAFRESSAAAARADRLTALGGGADYRVGLAIHKARLASRIAGAAAARQELQQAMRLAETLDDSRQLALVSEMTAVEHFESGDLERAEAAARAAGELRRKTADPLLSSSLLTLSRILQGQGRAGEALEIAEQAMAELKTRSPQRPLFRFYQVRGEAKAALGQLAAAREDLRQAVAHLRLLRPDVIPAEAVRMRAAASQQEVFAALAEVCNEIYLRSHRVEDLWEAFAAANENRAWTMRQVLGRKADPSPGYASAVTALQAAELAALREQTPESLAALAAARLHITELEFAPGLALPSLLAPNLRQLQAQLPRGMAVIQFQAGRRKSYVWALTAERLTMVPLAPSAELRAAVRRMRERIEEDSPAAAEAAHEVHQALFARLPHSVLSSTRWTVLPDQFLYQIPYAALVSGFSNNRPHYLIEDVALQLTPFLATRATPAAHDREPKFVGFGDPIYNTADARWQASAAPPAWFQWASRPVRTESTSLPRLPGTALEIKRSAQAWNGPATAFTGVQVSAASLRAAFVQQPEVIHLATHLVPGAADPSESRLLLSLSSNGEPELLDPVAVSHLDARCSLVVMSGCRAGAADAIASEGLLGLSRAWLAAGAASVLATQWPMPDDSGEMWSTFYRAWRASQLPPGTSRAALALQTAQKEMLTSSSWRARPRFWASYFVIGSR